MSKQLKRALTHIKMTLLFIILSSIVLYFAGAPLLSYVKAQCNMAIDKGAPNYQSGDLLLTDQIVLTNRSLDPSEIQIPEKNTQYGSIVCSRINLEAPVYYGDDENTLQNGAGQYTDSGMPGAGKPILIGGHDDTYFAPLENIAVGDIVTITTDYGLYYYQVNETKVAREEDRSAYDLTQDREQLILYTCYPFGKVIGDRSERYFVYCDRVPDTAEGLQ